MFQITLGIKLRKPNWAPAARATYVNLLDAYMIFICLRYSFDFVT